MPDTAHPRPTWQRRVLMGAIGVIVLGIIAYVAYDTWSVGQRTQALLRAPGIITAADANDPEKQSEGSDSTEITTAQVSEYTVAADAPRMLTIERLGVNARIKPMGLNSDKSIQAPKNIYDAGWYTGSAKPGTNGAMFIDGHASGASRFGLFGNLDRLKTGDMIGVEKGDGATLNYRVVTVAVIPLASLDMRAVLAPYSGVEEGLNLMTCTGTWMDEAATLDHRVVVYTERV